MRQFVGRRGGLIVRVGRWSGLKAAALGVLVAAAVIAQAASAGREQRTATPVPMTHPLPATQPPGWIDIGEVSNGCGPGAASTEPGVISLIADSSTFRDGNPGDPSFEVNFREACLLHDAGYSGALVWDSLNKKFEDFSDPKWTRKAIDDKFYDDMAKICELKIPSMWETTLDNCKTGIARWLAVRVGGWTAFKPRIDLTGKWFDTNPGWPLCDTGVVDWTVTQNKRKVTASWQHGTSGGAFGHFEGVVTTRDHDSIVVGTYSVTEGPNGPKVRSGTMTWVVSAENAFDFNGSIPGGHMERREQAASRVLAPLLGRAVRGPLAQCSRPQPGLTTTTAQGAAESPPTRVTLTVNGWTLTATKAKPAVYLHHEQDQPLASETPLTIRASIDHPLPAGWKLVIYHNGDVLSQGNGVWYKVCEIDGPSTATSCGGARPGRVGPFDDIVWVAVSAPTYLAMHSDIYFHFNKP